MHIKGEGVPQSYVEAVKWFRLAAEQGHATSQAELGIGYTKGEGVPQNYVIAHMWFNLAASQGDAKGMKNRDFITKKMTQQQIAEAQKLAAEWKPKTWDELKHQVPK